MVALRLSPAHAWVIFWLAAPVVALDSARAQTPPSPDPDYAFEIRTRERWMHDGQQPRFTPHHTATEWLSVDSVNTTAPGERTMFVSRPAGRLRDSGWVRFADDGGVNDARYFFAPLEPRPTSTPRAEARHERNRLFRGFALGDYLRLPEFRLHQLVPRFSAARMVAGERWSDTIAIAAERDGFEQRVDGRRVSTIIGDTVVAGRRLHIVRDSASVQYHERWLREERTLDTLVVTQRDAAGVVVGRYLYDPDLGLFRVREDSTRLSGTALLRYPDGRSFRTPARYERTRRIDLYDADEYVERREELRVASRAASGGMLIQPSTPVEEKLAAGDPLLRDSLLDVLRTTRDADERQSLWTLLRMWWRGDDHFAALLDRAADVDADTAHLIRTLQGSYVRGARQQFDETTVRRSLPFMADPSLVFRYNAPLDPFYENPRQALLRRPPAASDDTTQWACTPAACRLLAEQVNAEGDARLRALGLIASFVLDPRRYAEEVARRAQAGETFLAPAAALARGEVGRTAPAPAAAPLPQSSADWREWLHWLDAYSVALGQQPRLRFDASHRAALRFRERLSGRDIVDELTARRGGETADSALLVYDYLLLVLGELRPQADSIARMLESDSDIVRARGQIALPYLFSDAQPVAPDTAAVLIDHLLGTLIEGDVSWPMLPGIDDRLRPRRLGDWDHRPQASVFLNRSGLPQAVIEAWSGRAQVVSEEEWDARSTRVAGIILSVGELRRVGPFVRISADYMSQFDREPNEAPRGYAGGIRLTLMQTSRGWVIVKIDSWVT